MFRLRLHLEFDLWLNEPVFRVILESKRKKKGFIWKATIMKWNQKMSWPRQIVIQVSRSLCGDAVTIVMLAQIKSDYYFNSFKYIFIPRKIGKQDPTTEKYSGVLFAN